jgi:hypothetical protein
LLLALLAAMALSLLVAAGLGTAAPEPAFASSCGKRLSLSVSKRKVRVGQRVRVQGRACTTAARKVRIKLRGVRYWRVRTASRGRFSMRMRVRVRGSARTARIQATAPGAGSDSVKLRVLGGNCPLSHPRTQVGLTLGGCRVVSSDTASDPDPEQTWGNIECGSWENPIPSRHQRLSSGGDSHPTAQGQAQAGDFRRLTVIDGDDWSGERCELGLNDHQEGPTALYREGQRRATFFSMRLPDNFPLDANTWQTVFQMKQAQPSDNGGGVPVLFMGAYLGEWHIESANGEYWSFPAQKNTWTRFVFDVTYSQDSDRGSLQVAADLNGDGDVGDSGERSPRIRINTLMTEADGPNGSSDGLAPGDPIPSHMRAGIYHNPSIACLPPVGCSTELDNVQVLAP